MAQNKILKSNQKNPSNPPHEILHPIPNLPQEVIFNILSKLPSVSSISRCKCVCRAWRSLISDPYFVKTHLKLSTQNDDYAHQRIIFICRRNLALQSYSLQSVLYDSSSSVDATEVDYPLKSCCNWAQIVGSCNGLVCVANNSSILYFSNPSTGRSMILTYHCPEGIRRNISYGFGYDLAGDDYKVVLVYWNHRGDAAFVRVYTLRTNSWRRIQDFPPVYPFDNIGKFTNGALHWGASRQPGLDASSSNDSWVIVSFDLGKESYGEILQPEYGVGVCSLVLGVLEENLCVTCNFHGVCTDIWVMKEYGVRESWMKLVSIPYLTGPQSICYLTTPLCISKNGDMLLEAGNCLVLYNCKDHTWKTPEIGNYDAALGVHTYVESLVSPHMRMGLEV